MKSKLGVTLALILLTGLARGQDLIDRRDQAREAFLSTPDGIYGHYCAHCHGESGQGSGRLWATELSPPPADLTALDVDKEYLLVAIRDGSAAHGKSNLCPPWGRTLSSVDIERLGQYVLSLRSEAPETAAQEESAQAMSQPFPWLLMVVLVGEAGLLGWWLRRRKELLTQFVREP